MNIISQLNIQKLVKMRILLLKSKLNKDIFTKFIGNNFDHCIDHKLLIEKLYLNGNSLSSINLLSSYLNNQTQQTKSVNVSL